MTSSVLDAVDRAPSSTRTTARVPVPQDVQLVPTRDRALWDVLARTVPGGSAFHDAGLLDLQERLLGIAVERLLVQTEGRPVGIVPLARRGPHGLRAPWLPFPLLGPAVPLELLAATLAAVRHHQRRHHLLLARLDVGPALAAAVGPLPAGWRGRADRTVVLDLSHGCRDQLDARMHRSRRQHINRAARAGVVARAARPGEVAAVLGPALAAAYGRRNAPDPYPADLGERIEVWAADRDDVFLGVVERDGRLLGATVLLGTHPTAAGWVGGCLPEGRTLHAEAVLTREALRWAIRRGHPAVDFAGRVCDAVEQYKLSFGGRSATYLTVEGFLGPWRVRDALAGAGLRR